MGERKRMEAECTTIHRLSVEFIENTVTYLIGLSIIGYSLDIGMVHVNLIDERLQKLIYNGQLDGKQVDR